MVECKDKTFLHVIPLIPDKKLTSPINYDQTKRASSCEIVVSSKTVKCNLCAKLEEKKKANPCQKLTKTKAPLSACSSSKLLETIREVFGKYTGKLIGFTGGGPKKVAPYEDRVFRL